MNPDAARAHGRHLPLRSSPVGDTATSTCGRRPPFRTSVLPESPAYNPAMQEQLAEGIKSYIQFGPHDVARLRALAVETKPFIPHVVDRFYARVLRDPGARAVFASDEEHHERQRSILLDWLASLLQGPYDAVHFEQHAKLGALHARAGFQQHYMVTATEVVRQELERMARAAGLPNVEEKLRSFQKLLSLELAIMLESYSERYSEQVRHTERTAVEEKLTRAEHLAEIGQLAASLAHEIKNPLAGISGAIQIIRDEMQADDPQQAIVTEILAQIGRLDATVKDLLQYARPTPPRLTAISLDQVVQRVLKVLQKGPALQRIRVEYTEGAVDACVRADDAQIEQLLINLILNAAHASDDGGKIRVAVGEDISSVRLTVKDFGTGMAKEVCSQAFEPFFTTKAKGTGLGLSICRRIVEVHGGSIELRSREGAGTTVTVRLPCRPDQIANGDKR